MEYARMKTDSKNIYYLILGRSIQSVEYFLRGVRGISWQEIREDNITSILDLGNKCKGCKKARAEMTLLVFTTTTVNGL